MTDVVKEYDYKVLVRDPSNPAETEEGKLSLGKILDDLWQHRGEKSYQKKHYIQLNWGNAESCIEVDFTQPSQPKMTFADRDFRAPLPSIREIANRHLAEIWRVQGVLVDINAKKMFDNTQNTREVFQHMPLMDQLQAYKRPASVLTGSMFRSTGKSVEPVAEVAPTAPKPSGPGSTSSAP